MLERIRTKQPRTCCGISFSANFISNHTKVQNIHVYPRFVLLRLFYFVQSVSNLQHWQTTVTLFTQFKLKFQLHCFLCSFSTNISITHEVCSNIYFNSFSQMLLCRIVECINLIPYYRCRQLLVESALTLHLFNETARKCVDWDSSFHRGNCCRLEGLGIKFQWSRVFSHPSRPALRPTHLPV